MKYLSLTDYFVFLIYFLIIAVYGLWIYRRKRTVSQDLKEYWLFISKIQQAAGNKPKGLEIEREMFRLSPAFTVGALFITGVLTALYTLYW